MPHMPQFPPVYEDWAPGDPRKGEPPLPRFLFNPWLSPAERGDIELEAGRWSTSRAEAIVPEKAGPEVVRQLATRFWQEFAKQRGITIPAAKAPERRKR